MKAQRGQTRVEVTIPEGLYDALSADDWIMLYSLRVLAGIDAGETRVSGRRLIMDNVVWSEAPCAECRTEDELIAALEQFAKAKAPSFRLVLGASLVAPMSENNGLQALAGRCGVTGLSARTVRGVIWYLDDVTYSDAPRVHVVSESEFLSAVADMADRGETRFLISFDPAFYDALTEETRRRMLALSRLSAYECRYVDALRTMEFSGVTYSSGPAVFCESDRDIVDAIAAFGRSGTADFRLVLTEALYRRVSSDGFKPLRALEAEAGLTGCAFSYSEAGFILNYERAVIVADIVRPQSLDHARHLIEAAVMRGEKQIALLCAAPVYDALMGAGPISDVAPIHDVCAQAGLVEYDVRYDQTTRLITIDARACYVGFDIVRATRSGDLSVLSETEMKTLIAARQWLSQIEPGEDAAVALQIHDMICDRTVYTLDDDTDDDDTAAGVLLSGQADCDGYADAFYLLASLSGLQVRYQHGDTRDHGEFTSREATHMWNLIGIDGTWRAVDVTWDDGDVIRHTWFNIGEDRLSRLHIWNSATTETLLTQTDPDTRPDDEYIVDSLDAGLVALRTAISRRQTSFELILTGEAAGLSDALVAELAMMTPHSFRYSWNDAVGSLLITNMSY